MNDISLPMTKLSKAPSFLHFVISVFLLFFIIHPTLLANLGSFDSVLKYLLIIISFLLISSGCFLKRLHLSRLSLFFYTLLVTSLCLSMFASFESGMKYTIIFNGMSFLFISVFALVLVLPVRNLRHVLLLSSVVNIFVIFIYLCYLWFTLQVLNVGQLRYIYPENNLNYNHLAIASAFSLVYISTYIYIYKLHSYSTFAIFILFFIFLGLLELFAFSSRTALLAVFCSFLCCSFRRHIGTIILSLVLLLLLFLYAGVELSDLYYRHGEVMDSLLSGRPRLWLYALNDSFEYILYSPHYQDSLLLVERTIVSGHSTAYLHNSFYSLVYDIGVVGALAFYSIYILSIYKAYKYCFIFFPVLIFSFIASFFESIMDYQKLGFLLLFLIFYLAREREFMKNE